MMHLIEKINELIPPWFYIALIVHGTVLGVVAYLILLERKIASWVQDRIGPNRTGLGFGIIPFLKDMKMFGLGQPLADGLKFIVKEDYRPKGADMILFTLAPVLMIVVIIVSIVTIPWGGVKGSSAQIEIPAGSVPRQVIEATLPPHHDLLRTEDALTGLKVNADDVVEHATKVNYVHGWFLQIANLNIGVLFILAILSMAVYGVVIGGWASNNKYSFLGGLRATANMISYEIPLGLSVLAIVLMYGTLDLGDITTRQAGYWMGVIPAWNVFTQPVAFLLFLICIHAEANRAPFDMAEAEQELVGGYHTEYSSMRFALFFLAEYAGMITTSAICIALFFGGWHLPWIENLSIFSGLKGTSVVGPDGAFNYTDSILWGAVRCGIFFGKTVAVIFVFMWVRWSLPRFRFDQLMMLAWRSLIPISLAQVMITAIIVYGIPPKLSLDVVIPGETALSLFIANVVILVGAMLFSVMLPTPLDTNRKIRLPNSRYTRTPLPGGATTVTAATP